MRSRGWCFTVNNYTSDDIAYLMDQEVLSYRYMLMGFEKGKKKETPHIQGYVYFDNAREFDSIRKMFHPWHIEVQKGTFDQNFDYCTKSSDDYYEIGERLDQGKLNKERIEEIMKNPYENFHLYVQYRKAYQEIKNKEISDIPRKLYLYPEEKKLELLKLFKPDEVYMYPEDYDGQDVYITMNYTIDQWVERWAYGYPPKERVGYEFKYKNPRVVYILYSSQQEKESLIKKYVDIIDAIF